MYIATFYVSTDPTWQVQSLWWIELLHADLFHLTRERALVPSTLVTGRSLTGKRLPFVPTHSDVALQ